MFLLSFDEYRHYEALAQHGNASAPNATVPQDFSRLLYTEDADWRNFFAGELEAITPEEFDLLQEVAGGLAYFGDFWGLTRPGAAIPLSPLFTALSVHRITQHLFGGHLQRTLLVGDSSGIMGAWLASRNHRFCAVEPRGIEYVYQNHLWNFLHCIGTFRSLEHMTDINQYEPWALLTQIFSGMKELARSPKVGLELARSSSQELVSSSSIVHVPWWHQGQLATLEKGDFELIILDPLLSKGDPAMFRRSLEWAVPMLSRDPFCRGHLLVSGWAAISTSEQAAIIAELNRIGIAQTVELCGCALFGYYQSNESERSRQREEMAGIFAERLDSAREDMFIGQDQIDTLNELLVNSSTEQTPPLRDEKLLDCIRYSRMLGQAGQELLK